ncbi:hypothetical protein RCC89_04365 [Cytophagaceae bacterium ABcell3]|nr:hypothetical protein RCC89_04365 [Cytophagaceae bacterium ABcell3]
MNIGVSSYCQISPTGVFKNGVRLMKNEWPSNSFNEYARGIYDFLNIAYPKYFKMDELCKLAFLATEVLLSNCKLRDSAETAIVIGNKHSSLASDEKHFESYKNRGHYYPSPAVFVYTLPNIMLGEICIRNRIFGENSCFIMEDYDAGFLYDYVNNLIANEGYTSCITGYIDYISENYSASLYLVEKDAEDRQVCKFNREALLLPNSGR